MNCFLTETASVIQGSAYLFPHRMPSLLYCNEEGFYKICYVIRACMAIAELGNRLSPLKDGGF
jgi:hypothetical protein